MHTSAAPPQCAWHAIHSLNSVPKASCPPDAPLTRDASFRAAACWVTRVGRHRHLHPRQRQAHSTRAAFAFERIGQDHARLGHAIALQQGLQGSAAAFRG